MKDKGILFKPDMAKAADEGRKGQTRRMEGLAEINKDPDAWFYIDGEGFYCADKRGAYNVLAIKCPYAVGERMYLKETHYRYGKWVRDGLTKTGKHAWRFRCMPPFIGPYFEDNIPTIILDNVRPNTYRKMGWYKRSPLFMPQKFARKWFVVTAVVAERLQDISEADAIAEGLSEFLWDDEAAKLPQIAPDIAAGKRWWNHVIVKRGRKNTVWDCPVKAFRELWQDIHGPGSWDLNPWLWKVTFDKKDN